MVILYAQEAVCVKINQYNGLTNICGKILKESGSNKS